MVFDKSGSLAGTKRHDYPAFGEEWFAGMGGRTTGEGYVADGVRQKFTQKERDNETGLDYFGVRYFASVQGRFTAVDPYNIILERQDDEDSRSATKRFIRYLGDPQNWNRYSYVTNNPLKFVDPDGAEIRYSNADPSATLKPDEEQALRAAVAALRQQSAVAEAFFSLYDKPAGQGPDLDVQIMADQLFNQLPEVTSTQNPQNVLGSTSPGLVDINPSNPNDVRSASAVIVIRQRSVNPLGESRARANRQETLLEGILSHEGVHAAQITMHYNGFRQAQDNATKNKIPYRDRPNESLANAGLNRYWARKADKRLR